MVHMGRGFVSCEGRGICTKIGNPPSLLGNATCHVEPQKKLHFGQCH